MNFEAPPDWPFNISGTDKLVPNRRFDVFKVDIQWGKFPFNPITENRDMLPVERTIVGGSADFRWRRELSPDGQLLYKTLTKGMGDVKLLPIHAVAQSFNLNNAMTELRKHGLLDESNPRMINIMSRRL